MFDFHCHLADPAFADDLDAVIDHARAAGVQGVLCILAADDEAEAVQADVVRAAWDGVRFSTGIHPHRAGAWAGRVDDAREVLEAAMASRQAIAVGEIGLDYHYDFSARDVQRDMFAMQVAVASTLDRPVVIHAREAIDDTIAILAAGGPHVRGVMHCFTGTVDEARRALDLDFYISISGIATFPRAAALREVAAFVPADRLLIETDAPYLAPVPYRGQRNEPAWVLETFRMVAAARQVAEDDLGRQLAANTLALLPALGTVAR